MTRERAFSSNHVSLVQHGGAGVVANCAGPLSRLFLIPFTPLFLSLPISLLLGVSSSLSFAIVHSPSAPFPFRIHTFQSLNHSYSCFFSSS